MFDLDKWQEIYETVRKHKLRTGLTAFGVFWGIFMLVILLGAGKGLENGVKDGWGIAKNTIFIWGGNTSIPYKGFTVGREILLNNDDYIAIKNKIPEVKYIAPEVSHWERFKISYLTKNGLFDVQGLHPDFREVVQYDYPFGRFFNNDDLSQKRKVAVIGDGIVKLLFNGENPVGKYINIKGVFFLVVGTFVNPNSGENGRRDGERILIPLTTFQQVFNKPNQIHQFKIIPLGDDQAEEIEKKVKMLLINLHNVSPEDQKAIGSFNVGKEFQKINGLFLGINTLIWIVGVGTILAGIVGVSNIMLIIVKERTKEIGIRKALGATPGSIVSLIIMESIVITSISGYIGLMCGVGLLEAVSGFLEKSGAKNEFFKNPEVDINIALMATAVLVVTGTLAGLIPARNAAKINPIEALRAE